ncbi:cytochrome P450 71A1-like [Yasminevirus sp. GU-2018]|uniref:Cytochrome P450 71A1-like n=1 Tax=Yasminevirus sp. GU-2018 TaxID=2420051 RepID=A0A5K0UBQ7_9VIRU|nr:cytochrome P450 71A1-like [Yasminevirus sp. GU-2018]
MPSTKTIAPDRIYTFMFGETVIDFFWGYLFGIIQIIFNKIVRSFYLFRFELFVDNLLYPYYSVSRYRSKKFGTLFPLYGQICTGSFDVASELIQQCPVKTKYFGGLKQTGNYLHNDFLIFLPDSQNLKIEKQYINDMLESGESLMVTKNFYNSLTKGCSTPKQMVGRLLRLFHESCLLMTPTFFELSVLKIQSLLMMPLVINSLLPNFVLSPLKKLTTFMYSLVYSRSPVVALHRGGLKQFMSEIFPGLQVALVAGVSFLEIRLELYKKDIVKHNKLIKRYFSENNIKISNSYETYVEYEKSEYFKDVVNITNEFLRLAPAVEVVTYSAKRDMITHHCSIPIYVKKGDPVNIHIPTVNRDPKRYKNPDKFIIDRDYSDMITFNGKTAKRCPAENFIRKSLYIIVFNMLVNSLKE